LPFKVPGLDLNLYWHANVENEPANLSSDNRIESARWFVKKNYLWTMQKCTRDQKTLLHAV